MWKWYTIYQVYTEQIQYFRRYGKVDGEQIQYFRRHGKVYSEQIDYFRRYGKVDGEQIQYLRRYGKVNSEQIQYFRRYGNVNCEDLKRYCISTVKTASSVHDAAPSYQKVYQFRRQQTLSWQSEICRLMETRTKWPHPLFIAEREA